MADRLAHQERVVGRGDPDVLGRRYGVIMLRPGLLHCGIRPVGEAKYRPSTKRRSPTPRRGSPPWGEPSPAASGHHRRWPPADRTRVAHPTNRPTAASGSRDAGGEAPRRHGCSSSGAAEPTVRRATDVMLLVPSLLVLVVLIVAQPASGIEQALIDLIASLPGWLDALWGLTYDLLALLAIGLLVAAFVTRRTSVALHALLAVVLSLVIAAGRLAHRARPLAGHPRLRDRRSRRLAVPRRAHGLVVGRRRDDAARPRAADAARRPLAARSPACSAPCCSEWRRRAASSPAW